MTLPTNDRIFGPEQKNTFEIHPDSKKAQV